MTQVQKSLTARKWYDSKKSSVSWSSSRFQKLLRTVTHLYCCSHRVPLPCLVIQPEISCKGGSENLWRWGAETMSWIKYRSNTNRYELYHPIAHRQFQRHWNDATFCFFYLWPWWRSSTVSCSLAIAIWTKVSPMRSNEIWSWLVQNVKQGSSCCTFLPFHCFPGDNVYGHISQKCQFPMAGESVANLFQCKLLM